MKKPIVVAVVGLLAAAPACSVDHDTQITVAIASEAEVPNELAAFRVTVTVTGQTVPRFQQVYNPTDGKDFPTTLAVIPVDEDSLGKPVEVKIEGWLAGTENNTDTTPPALTRTSIASYVEGRNLLLAMPLRMACLGFAQCASGQTCAGGQCVAATVASASLPNFAESLLSSTAPSCFDEDSCLAAKSLVDVVDHAGAADDCTFPIPSKDVNVAIRWADAPARLLTLDSGDATEGWTATSDAIGKLSQGVCNSHFQRKDAQGNLIVSDWAKQVYVTTGCPAKTSTTPYCKNEPHQVGIGATSPE